MNSKKFIYKALAACLAFAVWSVSSMFALAAAAQGTAGELTVTGSVTVDNRAAISNSTINSGSTIKTGDNSTATVSLGKLGRVELLANSTLILKFDDNGIFGTLNEGKVRVTNVSGVNTNISTLTGMAVADTSQANTFTVEKESCCGSMRVETQIGSVALRGTGNEEKQVAAGTDGVVGQQTGCKPCMRPIPGAAGTPVLGLGAGALIGLLLAAGAAVATGVALSKTGGNDVNTTGGGIIVVSPTR